VRFQFLFFQAFNEAGVSLVPGLAVPRTTVPELSINHTELVNFIQAIISTGTISVGKQSKKKNNNLCSKNSSIISGGEHEKGSHSNKLQNSGTTKINSRHFQDSSSTR
jgi:hypothetical protein